MAESSFPFQSIGGDRAYGVSHWTAFFKALLTNGVFLYGNELEVLEDSGMDVTLKDGVALIEGEYYSNSADLTITIDPADPSLDRIDRVVIRRSVANREITAEVLKGTPAGTPTAPALTQTVGGTFELARADIYVAAAATSIAQADITDNLTNVTVCGVSTMNLDLDSINTALLALIETIEDELALVIAGGIPSHGATHTQGSGDEVDLSAEIITYDDSHTLALTDAGRFLKMTKATANTVTIPLFSAVAFPVGTEIEVVQWGAGTVTVAATGGVTLHSADDAVDTAVQYASIGLKCIAQDEWLLTGYLA